MSGSIKCAMQWILVVAAIFRRESEWKEVMGLGLFFLFLL